MMRIDADDKRFTYMGRIDWENKKAPVWVFPCTSVKFRFSGNLLRIRVKNHKAYWDNYLGCILDGEQTSIRLPEEGYCEISIPVVHKEREFHEVCLFKRQDSCHELTFMGVEISEGEELLPSLKMPQRRIEVYGDSVSAGEVSEAVNFTEREDPPHNGEYSNSWYSYAWMTARKLDAQIHDIAQGGIALMDETGWFCEPKYVGMEKIWDKIQYNLQLGKAKSWDFSSYTPDVVIVAIGQNDSHPVDFMKDDYEGELAGKWRRKYGEFLIKLREKYPCAWIICCTTLLNHETAWDRGIGEVVQMLKDEKITQYLFRRNGKGTPGHLRISEAEEMAQELSQYIISLGIEGW